MRQRRTTHFGRTPPGWVSSSHSHRYNGAGGMVVSEIVYVAGGLDGLAAGHGCAGRQFEPAAAARALLAGAIVQAASGQSSRASMTATTP
jgi:hypothetical protein